MPEHKGERTVSDNPKRKIGQRFAPLTVADIYHARRLGRRSSRALHVLAVLRLESRGAELVKVSARDVARTAGIARSTVIEALVDLEEINFIRKSSGLRAGGNIASMYQLLPAPPAPTEMQALVRNSDKGCPELGQGVVGESDKAYPEVGQQGGANSDRGCPELGQHKGIEEQTRSRKDIDRPDSPFTSVCSAATDVASPKRLIVAILSKAGVGHGARAPWKQRSNLADRMVAAGLKAKDAEAAARNAVGALAAGRIKRAHDLAGYKSQMPRELLKRVGGYAVGVINRAIEEGQEGISLNAEVALVESPATASGRRTPALEGAQSAVTSPPSIIEAISDD